MNVGKVRQANACTLGWCDRPSTAAGGAGATARCITTPALHIRSVQIMKGAIPHQLVVHYPTIVFDRHAWRSAVESYSISLSLRYSAFSADGQHFIKLLKLNRQSGLLYSEKTNTVFEYYVHCVKQS